MERKVTCRTKGSKTVQKWIKGKKSRTEKKEEEEEYPTGGKEVCIL
jgi:hypothetical protein